MRQEAIHAGLAPAGELLAEVDILADVADGVVVGALFGSLWAEHVAQQCGVSDFLFGHELDEEAVFRC